MIKKILLIMAMLFFATNANAEDWLTPGSNDWLMINFVDKFINPDNMNVFSGINFLYLRALLLVGGILGAYTLIAGTMATAHDGQMLGKKWSSMWLPIRTALGTAMIMPVVNGFCCVQVIIYSMIKMALGLAFVMIPIAIAFLTNFMDYSSVSSNLEVRKLAKDAILGAACVQLYNNNMQKYVLENKNAGFPPDDVQYFSIKNFQTNGDTSKVIGYQFGGTKDFMSGDKTESCGFIKLEITSEGQLQKDIAGQSGYKPLVDVAAVQSSVQQAQATALGKMINEAIAYAPTFINTNPADAKSVNDKVESLTAEYVSSMNVAGRIALALATNVDAIADITERGWAFFGAYYMKIVQAINGTTAAINSVPASSGQVLNELNDFNDNFMSSYTRLQKLINNSDTYNNNTTNTAGQDSSVFTRVIKSFTSSGGTFGGDGKSDQLLSITQQVNVGNHVLNTVAAAGITASSISLLALIPKLSDVLIAAGTIIGPFFSFLMIVGLINGMMLAYVIPMIPYIIWIGIVVSYMAVCIEAMVAAPMWALAHLAPDADDVIGKQGQGYHLILILTLKPALAIFGFLASFVIMCAGAALINATFLIATSFVSSGFLGLTYSIAMTAVYMTLNLNNTMNATRIMSTLPDSILEWIGARATSLSGKVMSGSEEAVSNAKSNVSDSTQKAGHAVSNSMSNGLRQREKSKEKDLHKTNSNDGDNQASKGSDEPKENTDKGNRGQSIKDIDPK